ncbi:MAG: polyprenyl synthetase family protein [Ardenticatenaceae bacterium]|nr:polyprenyl synthetase family protein [Ardenticatenaceae bacterium]
MIDLDEIGSYFYQQPTVADWPALQTVWQHYARNPGSWRLPELACQAVGGELRQVVPLITAVACCHISIVLVDDILDDDPKGLYRQLGTGEAANLGLAFQAVAYQIVQAAANEMGWETAVQQQILAELAHLNLKTAQGQHLDVQETRSEAHYWATVEAKSTPYYGAGFFLGALAGGAEEKLADQLRHFGQLIGKIIQVSDDLADVYQIPACPDWQRGGGNLAILYARLAEHPEQDRFEELLDQINEPTALEEAQQILLRSGAASYCIYQLLQLASEARTVLDGCTLTNPAILQEFLAERVRHLFELLEENKMPLPEELAAAILR